MNHVRKNADDYQQQTNKQLYTSHNNQNKHPNNFEKLNCSNFKTALEKPPLSLVSISAHWQSTR